MGVFTSLVDLAKSLLWMLFLQLTYLMSFLSPRLHLKAQAWALKCADKSLNAPLEKTKLLLFSRLDEAVGASRQREGEKLEILEIGVGTGINFQYYPRGVAVTCVEPNPFFCDSIRAASDSSRDVTVRRVVTDVAEDMCMFEEESFDAVVSTLVMCSVSNIDTCLQGIYRILKKVCIVDLCEI